MIKYLKRIHAIVSYWSPIIGSYFSTFLFFFRAKFGIATISAKYCGIPFRFRSSDLTAIDETLIRGEYQFIIPVIEGVDEPLVIDVGMNVGDFAIFAVSVNPRSRIVGLEADDDTASVAISNNPRPDNGVWAVYNRAAWGNNEQIYLERGTVSVSNRVSAHGHNPVKGIDLMTLWELLPSDDVDVMKIDIEGAEEAFLFSQPEYLKKVRHLIIEIHPNACNEARVLGLLNEHYTSVTLVPGRISSKPLLHCMRT